VFKSTNAAVTWSAFNNGLPNMPSIFALVIDPITPSRLFAATADGVFLLQQVAAVCAGDCGGTHAVGVNDVITLVNIALGNAQPAACSDGGLPLGGEVDVSVIIQAVNSALHGCS
jgi:hypothetical protein